GVNACTRRNRSNTPLQALTLLNDQAFVEMAQGLAWRVLHESLDSDSARLTRAFQLCLGREPSALELNRLNSVLIGQRSQLSDAEAARLAPERFAAGFPPRDFAAWTTVARVLLNLDEFITRE